MEYLDQRVLLDFEDSRDDQDSSDQLASLARLESLGKTGRMESLDREEYQGWLVDRELLVTQARWD